MILRGKGQVAVGRHCRQQHVVAPDLMVEGLPQEKLGPTHVMSHPRGDRQGPLGQGGSWKLVVQVSYPNTPVPASGAHPSNMPLKNEMTLQKK